MTFMELAKMSDNYQIKWISEHSDDEFKALVDAWLEETKRENAVYNINRFRERRKMCEISYAILKGNYSGVTSDGKPWRIDFSDPHVDDWHDQYYHGDYN